MQDFLPAPTHPGPCLPFLFSSSLFLLLFFSWFQHPFTTVLLFFFRVASLFIDNNNVHFTVWFWDIRVGRVRGARAGPQPGRQCPVVSLCVMLVT